VSEDNLAHLERICLALPEAVRDDDGVGSPAYKVRGKIFAMQHGMDGRGSVWCKAQPGLQAVLVETEPAHFFVPPYVGHHGWVGHWLDIPVDWAHVGGLIVGSYRMTAPKKLIALL
jgi:hypothetical protein